MSAVVIQTKRKPTGAAAMGPGPGRPKGSQNKTTVALKDAILGAAECVGLDGKGEGGLQGYLQKVAAEDVKAFSSLLGRVLPVESRIGDPNGNPIPLSVPMVNITVKE